MVVVRAVVRVANLLVVGVLYLSVFLVVGTGVVVVLVRFSGGDGNGLVLLVIVEYWKWW